ncbi:MAG: hypothetical protein QXV04_04815 [Desulfurococcaceae archaeon]
MYFYQHLGAKLLWINFQRSILNCPFTSVYRILLADELPKRIWYPTKVALGFSSRFNAFSDSEQ